MTNKAACGPFTPSKSGQRSRSLYYRCCWHRVSNLFFLRYRHRSSSRRKGVYTPKGFFLHAASLHQAFAHCGIFSTAASRRSMGRVTVPLLGVTLSRPLPVVALVGRYPTNKLIGPRPVPERFPCGFLYRFRRSGIGPSGISSSFNELFPTRG